MNTELIRNDILKNLRHCLFANGYIETVTQIMRACDSKINPRFELKNGKFLRDCMELPLRQKITKECPKVFEIGPCFRMDKIDRTHFSEFCMMELYSAGESIRDMVTLMSNIIVLCAPKINRVKEVSVRDYIIGDIGVDISSEGTESLVEAILTKYDHLPSKAGQPHITVNEYIEVFIEQTLTEKDCLYFLLDYPLCSIAVANRKGKSNCLERFECFINGMEVANAFEDCTDTEDLEGRLIASGIISDEEESLISLTKNGDLFETVGLGIGIDRLCLLSKNK